MNAPLPFPGAALLASADWFWPSVAAGAIGVAALIAWAVVRIVREVGRAGSELARTNGDTAVQLADRLARALRTALHVEPKVIIDGVTEQEGYVAARELATVSQRLTRRHDWSHTRLWSTKRVTMSATFMVKAGFDLGQPVEISVSRDGGRAEVRWPSARILSVQIETLHPAEEETGWWNRITAEDRAAVQSEMQRLVDSDAVQSGLLELAETELRLLLEQQAQPLGAGLQLRFGGTGEAPLRGSGEPAAPSLPSPGSWPEIDPDRRQGSTDLV